MSSLRASLLILVALMGTLCKAAEVPAKPADFLLDDAKVFSTERAVELKRELSALNTEQQVSCYIATFSSIEGGIKQRAFSLMEDWLGNEPGLLVAYSWGEGLPKVMPTPTFWNRYPTDEVLMMLQRAAPILNDANLTASKRLSGAVEIYLADIKKMEALRQIRERSFPSEERPLVYWLAAVLVALSAVVWVLASWARRKLARHETFFLPEVEVGRRLGAPYGGGKMAQTQGFKGKS